MNANDAIGGYFELETARGCGLHPQAAALNSGRHSLEYILRRRENVARVYLPYYTCSVVLQPLQRLGIPHAFYHLDEQLHPVDLPELTEGELVIGTNYFGISGAMLQDMAARFGNRLLVDNAQALYDPPMEGIDTFYSPRKFFGVPDGGYAYCAAGAATQLPQDSSWQLMQHLLQRVDEGPESGYAAFRQNSETLAQKPIMRMSRLTQRLLGGINYAAAAEARRANYSALHRALGNSNRLHADLPADAVPMVYPYWVENGAQLRQRLIANRVFVATYWPNVLEWSAPGTLEHELATNLLALPIDQRYGAGEMQRILSIILG